MTRAYLAVCLAVTACLASAASAGALTYCVNSPGGACDQSFNQNQLQMALSTAAGTPDPDTVRIAPGTYSDGPYSYTEPSPNTVSIEGAGQAQTTLAPPAQAGAQILLNLAGATGSSVEDLTVRVPATAMVADGDTGMALRGEARRVTVEGDPAANNYNGVILGDGASFASGTVDLPVTAPSGGHGVRLDALGGSATVEDTTVSAQVGAGSLAGLLTVRRTRVRANTGFDTDFAQFSLENVLIDLGSDGSAGVRLANFNNCMTCNNLQLTADHVTIVGGGVGSRGVHALADTNGEVVAATVANTIISGPAMPLDCAEENGGQASIATSFSNYDAAANASTCAAGDVVQANRTNLPPTFAGPADFRLQATSPLVDAGDPGAGGPATDLDGGPRVTDGNADGVARRDIGAYERPAPPAAPSGTSGGAPEDTGAPGGPSGGGPAGFGPSTNVLLATGALRADRAGRIPLSLSNRNSFAVTGVVEGEVVAPRAHASARRARLRIGRAGFSVPAGSRATVKLRASKAVRAALRRARGLRTTLTATVTDPAGQTRRVTARATLRPPKAAKRRARR